MRGKDYKLAVVVFFFYLALIKQGGREGARTVSIVGTSYIQFILLSMVSSRMIIQTKSAEEMQVSF